MSNNKSCIKIAAVVLSLSLLIAAFVVNIISDQSLYNQNLNIVPQWQIQDGISSSSFINFMNLISVLLDPPVCAGYLALIWLFSSRRLEIMVFLIWFVFLSWLLSIVKVSIAQPRPFWMEGSGIQMQSWTCYTQFGNPSGHSWIGLVLLQYLVRFLSRSYLCVKKYIFIGYFFILIFQCLVMFSRVILGMHSFNEVLMGAMLGAFSIAIYYTYAQKITTKIMATVLNMPYGFDYFKSLDNNIRKRALYLFLFWFFIASCVIDCLVVFIPKYHNNGYWNYINTIEGCQNVKLVRSFQYRSLQDLAILNVDFGMLLGLLMLENPSSLVRELAYGKCSLKFLGRLLAMIIVAAVPLLLLIPMAITIDVSVGWLAVILWVCQTAAFFLALFFLTYLAPKLSQRLNLQHYGESPYPEPTRPSDQKKLQLQMDVSGDEEQSK